MAFIYVRQLAIHLRGALTHKTKEARRNVLNWQYVNSLEVWVDALVAHVKDEELAPLLYPVVQVVNGVIELAPTSRYFPLRFHCARMLNRLATAADGDVFVNAAPAALDALAAPELLRDQRAMTSLSATPFAAAAPLRVSKPALLSAAFAQGVLDQIEEIVVEAMAAIGQSLALPDAVTPVLVALRRFKKATPVSAHRRVQASCLTTTVAQNSTHRRQINALVSRLDAAAAVVRREQAAVDFAPKQLVQARAYLRARGVANPLAKYRDALVRRAAKRERLLLEGRKDSDKAEFHDEPANDNNDNNDNDDSDDSDAAQHDADSSEQSFGDYSAADDAPTAPPPRRQPKAKRNNNAKAQQSQRGATAHSKAPPPTKVKKQRSADSNRRKRRLAEAQQNNKKRTKLDVPDDEVAPLRMADF